MIAHVNDWMDGGLSIRDFADKIGIIKSKFSYWVSKVKASTDLQNQQPQFIDLSPVTDKLLMLFEGLSFKEMSKAQFLKFSSHEEMSKACNTINAT